MAKKTVKPLSPKVQVGQVRSGQGEPEMIYVQACGVGKHPYRVIYRSAARILAQDDYEYMSEREIETSFPVVESMTMEEFYDTQGEEPQDDGVDVEPRPAAPTAADQGPWKLSGLTVNVEFSSGPAAEEDRAFCDLVAAVAGVVYLPPGLAEHRLPLATVVRGIVAESLRLRRRTADPATLQPSVTYSGLTPPMPGAP